MGGGSQKGRRSRKTARRGRFPSDRVSGGGIPLVGVQVKCSGRASAVVKYRKDKDNRVDLGKIKSQGMFKRGRHSPASPHHSRKKANDNQEARERNSVKSKNKMKKHDSYQSNAEKKKKEGTFQKEILAPLGAREERGEG